MEAQETQLKRGGVRPWGPRREQGRRGPADPPWALEVSSGEEMMHPSFIRSLSDTERSAVLGREPDTD